MPLIPSEIALYRSAVWSNTPSANGGRMSFGVIAGVSGALFPDVYEAERIAGSILYRKAFYKVSNSANVPLVSPRAYIHGIASGDHAVRVALGTATDVETSMLAGNPSWYGCARLAGAVSAGATSLAVTAESSVPIFRIGDTVLLTSKATPDAAVGSEELLTLQSVQHVGDTIDLGFTTPLINSYAATGYAISVLKPSTLVAKVGTPVVSSGASGSVNVAGLSASGVGSLDATFTLTFTSSTSFTISNNAGLSLNTTVGSISGVTAPVGPLTAPLFSIQPSFWSGVWQAGDTVNFSTEAAAVPLWFARDIPANSVSASSSSFSLVIDGESA